MHRNLSGMVAKHALQPLQFQGGWFMECADGGSHGGAPLRVALHAGVAPLHVAGPAADAGLFAGSPRAEAAAAHFLLPHR